MTRLISAWNGLPEVAVGLATTGTVAVILIQERAIWLGWQAAAAAAWTATLPAVVSLSAAYAAYASGMLRHDGLSELAGASARPEWSILRAQFSRTARFALLPPLVPLIAAWILAIWHGALAPSPRDALWIAALIGSVVAVWSAFVLVGIWIGRTLIPQAAIPVSLIVPYLMYFASMRSAGLDQLAPAWAVTDGLGWTAYRTDGLALIVRILIWASVTATAAAMILRARRTTIIAGALTLAVVIGGSTHTATPVPMDGALSAVCDGDSTLAVCLPRYASTGLAEYRADVTQILAPLPLAARPTTITGVSHEESPDVPADAFYAPPVSGNATNTVVSDLPRLAEEFAPIFVDAECAPSTPGGQAVIAAYLWWWRTIGLSEESSNTTSAVGGAATPETVSVAEQMPHDALTSWTSEQWSELLDCQLSPALLS